MAPFVQQFRSLDQLAFAEWARLAAIHSACDHASFCNTRCSSPPLQVRPQAAEEPLPRARGFRGRCRTQHEPPVGTGKEPRPAAVRKPAFPLLSSMHFDFLRL